MPRRAKDSAWKQRLVGVAEIALFFGVEKSTVTRWANEGLLPEPFDTLKLGRVWSYQEMLILFETINPEDEHLGDDAGREFGRRLRALKTYRELTSQKGSSSTGMS